MKFYFRRSRNNVKQNFILKSFREYIWSSTPRELMFDWILPLLISLLTLFLMWFLSSNNTDIFLNLKNINNASINVIAILAGFNTASLAIISSINRDLLKEISTVESDTNSKLNQILNAHDERVSIFIRIKNLIMNNKKTNTLKITLNFFSYAVISQLVILTIGIVTSVFFSLLPNITWYIEVPATISKLMLSGYGVILMTLILHTIFVSIRNVEMIYNFILFRNNN